LKQVRRPNRAAPGLHLAFSELAMRLGRPLVISAALLCFAVAAVVVNRHAPMPGPGRESAPEDKGGRRPGEWWENQRAFPGTSVNQAAFSAAREQAQFDRARAALTTSAEGLIWTQLGPYNIGGRVTALAVAPGGTTVYLGAANGGVFKSVNSGVNWTPVTDGWGWELFSIGALALDPTNANVVYAGTGEANNSVDSYDGNGLLRSADGGQTWQSLGLQATARIARVAVDPSNPSRIFVAAMGTQFSTGPDRGLYRSEDGGQNWSRVLFVSDSTGATDVLINPAHPETVYCATLERVRRYTYRRAHGPESGIWRSADHGSTWTRLTSGLPTPSDSVGRIALALCATKPSIVYAQIGSGPGLGWVGLGMYRSLDGGQTWSRRDTDTSFRSAFGGFCWYFGDVAVDPNNENVVYAQGVSLMRSTNGGQTFSNVTGSAHVDQHGMWIDPANSNHLYLGNDGGFFSTTNWASTWFKSVDLPITQFYAGCVDPSNASRVGGGTQDNGSMLTASSPATWYEIAPGGDGFYVLIDPTNPNIVFSEWQNGSGGYGPYRSTNGGGSGGYGTGITTTDRFNWCAPFVMDPADHNVLLCASHRVYKSTNNGVSYTAVSGDLTAYPNPASSLTYHTITTLDISPADPQHYYAGTDDGRVWRSNDAGASWTNVSAGLPLYYVTRVTADPVAPGVVYVCLSGFGQDQHSPHVFRSGDQGATWAPVAGNLPDAPANDLVVDPADPNTLFLATDLGVYFTRNLGGEWNALGTGMPLQAIFDLTLHQPSRTLVAATHGRSQWKINLGALTVAVGRTATPMRIALSAPSPNPSRDAARFALALPAAGNAEVTVFDAAGRRVRELFSGGAGPGSLPLAWDGIDAHGHNAGAGIYFVRASAAGSTVTRRLVRVD
jgi:photosystem II stability/assembly factor-like uncharacterized protein